ncbi:MFS general substrate transporter, partial [Fragilariopsis cylindrus CCMP1102]
WRYWCIMLSLGVANSSDASEILCISYILSDKVFQDNILNDSAFGSGLLTGSVFLGMLLGGLIVGTMGDWIGRKPMLLLGLICNSISGILSSMAWNVYILSFLRMISGIGIGATVPPLFTLATELSPPSIRGFNVTICASFWMVGSIFVAIIALYFATTIHGIAIWRIFALICALPSALGAILVYWFVPESPRFLGVEGRSKEAVDVANLLVEKMGHQNNNDDDDDDGPLTIEELERTFPPSTIVDTTTVGGAGILDCMQFIQLAYIDFCSSTSKLYTTNKQIKQTTLALQMVWFALSFGSYGLLTWINIIFVKVHLENVYYNALLFAFSNLPGNILSGIYMDKIGRSKSLVGSIVLSSISLFFFAIFAEYEYSIGIVLSSCCFQCFTIMAWNTIDTMTSELFPTPCRSTGLGICAASGRIGALIAQFINGYLINSPVKLLLVASGTLLLGAITPYLLPNNGSRDMTGQPVND